MFAVPARAAGAAALLALACAAHAADNPTVDLTVNPSQDVVPGSTMTITGTVKNTSRKPTDYVAAYTVDGGTCGYHDEYSFSFKLGSGQSRTGAVNYTAPACAGAYTIVLSVTSAGNAPVVKTIGFTVAAPATQ